MNIILSSSIKALIAFILLLVVTRLIGRKGISRMTFFDFVVAIMLGSLGANLGIGSLNSAYSAATVIITISVLTLIFGYIHTKSFLFRKLVNSEPVVVIEKGQINEQNMRRIRLTINDLTTLLREKKVFNLADIEYAILENDGKISVLLKSKNQPLTPLDMKLPASYKGLNFEVIIDGNVMKENLYKSNHDENWLINQLRAYNISKVEDVFYAAIDSSENLYVSKKISRDEEHGRHGIE